MCRLALLYYFIPLLLSHHHIQLCVTLWIAAHQTSLSFTISFIFFYLSFCFCSDQITSIILSSRSLIHSSALFSLSFATFSSVCISTIELSDFDWLFFIVSSSCYNECSAFLNFPLFLSSPFWTGGQIDWRSLFHYLFFEETSLVFSTWSDSSASSFYFFFSVSMNLLETVIQCGLKELVLCGSIPV